MTALEVKLSFWAMAAVALVTKFEILVKIQASLDSAHAAVTQMQDDSMRLPGDDVMLFMGLDPHLHSLESSLVLLKERMKQVVLECKEELQMKQVMLESQKELLSPPETRQWVVSVKDRVPSVWGGWILAVDAFWNNFACDNKGTVGAGILWCESLSSHAHEFSSVLLRIAELQKPFDLDLKAARSSPGALETSGVLIYHL